jgi:hypothetical protein
MLTERQAAILGYQTEIACLQQKLTELINSVSPVKKKRQFSKAARARMARAQQARWKKKSALKVVKMRKSA